MQLLIAEDDRVTRAMLVAFAKQNGYEPVEAENGAQGLALMQGEDPPRLLLLDWMMPEMDGVVLCRAVRRMGLFPEPHIILLTARDEIDDIVYGLESGANDFITKPHNDAELRARLGVGLRYVKNQWALVEQLDNTVMDQLPGRQAVTDILQLEMIASQRDPGSLCIGIAELDGPDTDDRIQAFASGLRRALRPNDFLGDYGDNRFLVVANVPAPSAKEVFERMLGDATTGVDEDAPASEPLCGRIGMASFRGEPSPGEFLDRAESALATASSSAVGGVAVG